LQRRPDAAFHGAASGFASVSQAPGARRLPIVRALAATALTVATCMPAAPAFAQAGAGAERYEVTITPPRRPGSEPAADAAGVPPAGGEAASPPASGEPAAAASGTAAPVAGSQPAAAAPLPASDPATARATANLPLRTLQVGAYRQRSRAEQLQDALSPTFDNVDIVEVQSGGEPLYRVNVGRAPRGPALEDLKKRLAAAGFPAFEVLVPAAPAR
jgi:cell division protein FtsN